MDIGGIGAEIDLVGPGHAAIAVALGGCRDTGLAQAAAEKWSGAFSAADRAPGPFSDPFSTSHGWRKWPFCAGHIWPLKTAVFARLIYRRSLSVRHLRHSCCCRRLQTLTRVFLSLILRTLTMRLHMLRSLDTAQLVHDRPGARACAGGALPARLPGFRRDSSLFMGA